VFSLTVDLFLVLLYADQHYDIVCFGYLFDVHGFCLDNNCHSVAVKILWW